MHYKKSVVGILAVILIVAVAFLLIVPGLKHHAKTQANKIAVIYVDGVIVGGRGQAGIFNEQGGTDRLIKQLREAKDDKNVKAVVLRLNTPGGSAPAAQEVGEEIQKVRAAGKVVVTSMGDMAASGGYWLAASTDKIYANPATVTGSIGVYIPYSNWEGLYQKIGIHQEKIKSGPHKDILSPDRSMTPEEREMIQAMVDDLYQQFVDVVAAGRKMNDADVKKLADGRVFTGRQAKDAGLIDEFGDLYDAINGAAVLANLPGRPDVVEYGKKSPFNLLFEGESKLNLEKLLLRGLEPDSQTNGGFLTPLALLPGSDVK